MCLFGLMYLFTLIPFLLMLGGPFNWCKLLTTCMKLELTFGYKMPVQEMNVASWHLLGPTLSPFSGLVDIPSSDKM